MRMRMTVLAVALVCGIAVVATGKVSVVGAQVEATPQQEPVPARPTVVSKRRLYPEHYRRTAVKFTPWARPTYSQVQRIISVESAKWGVSRSWLSHRIECESGYDWTASNGSHFGLLQFAPSTFYRGVSTLGNRRVRWQASRIMRRPTAVVTRLSDGTTKRKRGYKVKVRRTRVYKGRLPRQPGLYHGWVQVRIGAQAMRGVSAVASGEWSCP